MFESWGLRNVRFVVVVSWMSFDVLKTWRIMLGIVCGICLMFNKLHT